MDRAIYGRMYNEHLFTKATTGRPKNVPLLSVSNHRSVMDDPALMSLFMTYKQLIGFERMRWGFCARDVCFRFTPLNGYLYAGKAVPIDRGDGISQEVMRIAVDKMRQGDWFHIFPEGKVVQLEKMGRFKWGCGKLLAESHGDANPLVLPFVTSGMEKMFDESKGKRERYIPVLWQSIRGIFGEPFDCSDLVKKFELLCENNPGWGDPWPPHREELYASITRRIEYKLRALWKQLLIVNELETKSQIIDPALLSPSHSETIYQELIQDDTLQFGTQDRKNPTSRFSLNLFFPVSKYDIEPDPREESHRLSIIARVKQQIRAIKSKNAPLVVETNDCLPFQKLWKSAKKSILNYTN